MSSHIPTPSIAHFTADDYDHIYEPAEDTFVLLDALEIDAEALRESRPALCVEIGSGSGVVSTFVHKLLGPTCVVFSLDINEHACSATLRTAKANDVPGDVVRCDLLSPLQKRIKRQVDLLVFNPPYVPTDESELAATQAERDIGGSWAGGQDGMRVTDIVLDALHDILAPGGRFYLVAVEPNRPADILVDMRKKGFVADQVLKRRAGRELLYVLRFTKPA